MATGRPPDSEQVCSHRQLHPLFLDTGLALETITPDPEQRQERAHQRREKVLAFPFQNGNERIRRPPHPIVIHVRRCNAGAQQPFGWLVLTVA